MSHRIDFGLVEGRKVELAIIKGGEFIVAVSTYGAAIVWFGTKDFNVVTYHKIVEDYINDSSYMGKIIGPVANRIENASFSIDGKVYNLEKNDGNNNLHSASACYGNKLWEIVGLSDSSVTLSLKTPEEGGFPGEHEVAVTYTISSDGILNISYVATSSQKCPIALTNHAYFVLDDRDCRDVYLTLPSSHYIATDSNLIPLSNNPTSVKDSDYDFNLRKRIGDRREGKYDNTWCLNGEIVKAEGNLAEIFIRTTEPGIQVYTGEFLNDKNYGPFSGIALETGRYPNSPNRFDFPVEYTEEGKEFSSITSICLKIKRK